MRDLVLDYLDGKAKNNEEDVTKLINRIKHISKIDGLIDRQWLQNIGDSNGD
jgi:hypothetical protein